MLVLFIYFNCFDIWIVLCFLSRSWAPFLCPVMISDNPSYDPLFICYGFHGFQLPLCWCFQPHYIFHIFSSLSLTLSFPWLSHLISLFYVFQSFVLKASLLFTLVLSCLLFCRALPLFHLIHSAAIHWSLCPFSCLLFWGCFMRRTANISPQKRYKH